MFTLPLHNPILQFSLILFIILFAPILLNKLKIPHLIGLIIAGAVIGPHGLNLMLRDSSIVLFGTVGLLYIMFLAGLEVDIVDFKKNSKKSAFFGMLTFSIPMTFGLLASLYILEYSLISSILLASMFASHTLIAYPIINKFGIAQNRAVNVAIGGTLITDTLALLVLAVIVGIEKGEISSQFWIQLIVSFFVFAGIVVFVFPIIARSFFKLFSDKISQYIFVLAMVFLGSFLAQLAGIEGIIGAFLTGLSMSRLIPRTSSLMNRIEFVGNALFIPIFLIGVGMLIDYKAFLQDFQTIKVGIVMTLVATVAKFSAAWITQKTYKFSADERRIIFGLSNAQAAATLAAVLVGYNIILNQPQIDAAALLGEVVEPIRLLSEHVLNGTILMILITCTHASFSAQIGAKNIALANATVESKNNNSRVLMPITENTNVQELLQLFNAFKDHKHGASLYGLHVLDTESSTGDVKALQLLEKAAKHAAGADNEMHKIIRYDKNHSNAIATIAKEQFVTDIFIAIEKEYYYNQFLGDSIDNLISKSETNLLVFNSQQRLVSLKRNIVVVPQYAEKEVGFSVWISKIWRLAKNKATKTIFYCHPDTLPYLRNYQSEMPIDAQFETLQDFSDFLILAKDIKNDDFVIVIMSRKDKPSYTSAMQKIPSSLRQYFSNNTTLLFFPMQPGVVDSMSPDFQNASITDPSFNLDEVGNAISTLFKNK